MDCCVYRILPCHFHCGLGSERRWRRIIAFCHCVSLLMSEAAMVNVHGCGPWSSHHEIPDDSCMVDLKPPSSHEELPFLIVISVILVPFPCFLKFMKVLLFQYIYIIYIYRSGIPKTSMNTLVAKASCSQSFANPRKEKWRSCCHIQITVARSFQFLEPEQKQLNLNWLVCFFAT